MLLSLLAPALLAAGFSGDTVVVLGRVKHDLTGDGHPEVLRLIGTGRTIDTLEVVFSITSRGELLYTARLQPLARRPGSNPRLGQATRAQHRARVDAFGEWFFSPRGFMTPIALVAGIDEWTRERPGMIPQTISGDCQSARPPEVGFDWEDPSANFGWGEPAPGSNCELKRAEMLWQEMQDAGITVFLFSPGGDLVLAIGWSSCDRRFYRLWQCC